VQDHTRVENAGLAALSDQAGGEPPFLLVLLSKNRYMRVVRSRYCGRFINFAYVSAVGMI
jgi:hypothetical protein